MCNERHTCLTDCGRLLVLLCTVAASFLSPSFAAARPEGGDRTLPIQGVVDRVKQRLGLEPPVAVELVPSDRFLVSVEAPPSSGGAFRIRIEERVLDLLSEDELEAALAHELGHVWVFTHHPFLQTETGANEVALRVVSREALARVYEKVWRHGGSKGSLTTFLGTRVGAAGPQQ